MAGRYVIECPGGRTPVWVKTVQQACKGRGFSTTSDKRKAKRMSRTLAEAMHRWLVNQCGASESMRVVEVES
jgi:hypothetical protein